MGRAQDALEAPRYKAVSPHVPAAGGFEAEKMMGRIGPIGLMRPLAPLELLLVQLVLWVL